MFQLSGIVIIENKSCKQEVIEIYLYQSRKELNVLHDKGNYLNKCKENLYDELCFVKIFVE